MQNSILAKTAIYLAGKRLYKSFENAVVNPRLTQRKLLLDILSRNNGEEMKLSHLADLYNEEAERELQPVSLVSQLRNLLKSGTVEQTRRGYYRPVQKISS